MEILLGIIAVMVTFNTIILIAVAGTLSKLIKHITDADEEELPQKKPASGELIDLSLTGPPTYDAAVFSGKTEPYTDGMDRRLTSTRNWDGISQQE